VLEKKQVDLNGLIAGVADDLRILAEQKQIKLEYKPRPQVYIMADPAQLRRVFLNLVDNAIKYTPSGGRVNISLETASDKIRVSVSDTGVGIPANELKNIFHRFYRSEQAGADIGFGLGLSIANSIILALQGSIEVTSTFGKGSSFTVILPFPPQS
jgi:signal transduction histidine kinase